MLLPEPHAVESDPVDAAFAAGRFPGLQAVLRRSPESVLDEIDASGLRGRGGAGFPAGRKWRMVAA